MGTLSGVQPIVPWNMWIFPPKCWGSKSSKSMNQYLSGILRELMPCLFGNFISDSFFGNYALIDLSRNDEQTSLLDMFYPSSTISMQEKGKNETLHPFFSGKSLKIITPLLLLWIFPQWVPFHYPRGFMATWLTLFYVKKKRTRIYLWNWRCSRRHPTNIYIYK